MRAEKLERSVGVAFDVVGWIFIFALIIMASPILLIIYIILWTRQKVSERKLSQKS